MRSLLAAAKGKSLTSILITLGIAVMVILIIAAIAVPNLLRSRIAANESSAVGSIRSINTALATYSGQHPEQGYPQNLSDLAPYLDANLANGQKSGYSFRYEPQPSDIDGVVKGFRIEAVPVTAGESGTRRFSSSESGAIGYRASPSGREQPLGGESSPPQQAARRPTPPSRRIMRKGAIKLIVDEPAPVAEKIRSVANRLNGYVDSVRSSDEGAGTSEASIVIRVPAAHFDEARREVRALGKRAKNEEDDARDVTGQYVDLESSLRNYRAEEAQYLEIMRRSGSIKDTLAVAERLADVRGRIERTQGQLNLMAHQTEMAVLEVSLLTEVVVQDVHWHPKAEMKAAFWNAADDLSTYGNFMIALAFRLPVLILWTGTLLVCALCGWRFLRWVWRKVTPATLPAA